MGSLLSADAAVMFEVQKGFPENANWRIIDTAGVTPSTGDNVLTTTLDIGEEGTWILCNNMKKIETAHITS